MNHPILSTLLAHSLTLLLFLCMAVFVGHLTGFIIPGALTHLAFLIVGIAFGWTIHPLVEDWLKSEP